MTFRMKPRISISICALTIWLVLVEAHLPVPESLFCADSSCTTTIGHGSIVKELRIHSGKLFPKGSPVDILGKSAVSNNSAMKVRFHDEVIAYIDGSYIRETTETDRSNLKLVMNSDFKPMTKPPEMPETKAGEGLSHSVVDVPHKNEARKVTSKGPEERPDEKSGPASHGFAAPRPEHVQFNEDRDLSPNPPLADTHEAKPNNEKIMSHQKVLEAHDESVRSKPTPTFEQRSPFGSTQGTTEPLVPDSDLRYQHASDTPAKQSQPVVAPDGLQSNEKSPVTTTQLPSTQPGEDASSRGPKTDASLPSKLVDVDPLFARPDIEPKIGGEKRVEHVSAIHPPKIAEPNEPQDLVEPVVPQPAPNKQAYISPPNGSINASSSSTQPGVQPKTDEKGEQMIHDHLVNDPEHASADELQSSAEVEKPAQADTFPSVPRKQPQILSQTEKMDVVSSTGPGGKNEQITPNSSNSQAHGLASEPHEAVRPSKSTDSRSPSLDNSSVVMSDSIGKQDQVFGSDPSRSDNQTDSPADGPVNSVGHSPVTGNEDTVIQAKSPSVVVAQTDDNKPATVAGYPPAPTDLVYPHESESSKSTPESIGISQNVSELDQLPTKEVSPTQQSNTEDKNTTASEEPQSSQFNDSASVWDLRGEKPLSPPLHDHHQTNLPQNVGVSGSTDRKRAETEQTPVTTESSQSSASTRFQGESIESPKLKSTSRPLSSQEVGPNKSAHVKHTHESLEQRKMTGSIDDSTSTEAYLAGIRADATDIPIAPSGNNIPPIPLTDKDENLDAVKKSVNEAVSIQSNSTDQCIAFDDQLDHHCRLVRDTAMPDFIENSSLHIGLVQCIAWAANQSFDKRLPRPVVRSPLSSLVYGFIRFTDKNSDALLARLSDRTKERLNYFLTKIFSVHLRFLVTWVVLVFQLLFSWLSVKLLWSILHKSFRNGAQNQFIETDYLKIEEHNLELADRLTEQEEINGQLSNWATELSLKLQNLKSSSAEKVGKFNKEIQISRNELDHLRGRLDKSLEDYRLLETKLNAQLKEKEKTVSDLHDKLEKANSELSDLEKGWKSKVKELESNNEKALEEAKKEHEELYQQALDYYNKMKNMQHEIDKLVESRKQAEEKLANTETELNSLRATFTTLKSFEVALEQEGQLDKQSSKPEASDCTFIEESSETEGSVHSSESNGVEKAKTDVEDVDGETVEENEEVSDQMVTEGAVSKTNVKSLNTEQKVSKLHANLATFLDIGKLHAELSLAESRLKSYEAKIQCQEELRAELELKMENMGKENSELKRQCEQMKTEKEAALTKLEVLSNYFKDRELELQKDLGKQAFEESESVEALNNYRKRNKELEAELKASRDQLASLRRELGETERIGRRQITELDKRSHENWLASRAAEHQVKELRDENTALRKKLMEAERALLPPALRNQQVNPARPVMSKQSPHSSVSKTATPPTFTLTSGLLNKRTLSGQSLASLSSQPPPDLSAMPFPPPLPIGLPLLPGTSPQSMQLPPPPPFLPAISPSRMRLPPGFPPPPPPPPPSLLPMGINPRMQHSSSSSVAGSHNGRPVM
ncbi:unnamed protein product [Calicophoron daubneyi]|uniref:Uncharacterized protein n=1 Tax=Calicophoron daubneyi TaxID=300641 RepID=A0AAV2T1I5_CALDB